MDAEAEQKLLANFRWYHIKTLDGNDHVTEIFEEMLEEREKIIFSLDQYKQLCDELNRKPIELYLGPLSDEEQQRKEPQGVFKL